MTHDLYVCTYCGRRYVVPSLARDCVTRCAAKLTDAPAPDLPPATPSKRRTRPAVSNRSTGR